MPSHQSKLASAMSTLTLALALGACSGATAAYRPAARGVLDVSRVLPAPTPGPHEARIALQPLSRRGAPRDAAPDAFAPYLLERTTLPAVDARSATEAAQVPQREPALVSTRRRGGSVSAAKEPAVAPVPEQGLSEARGDATPWQSSTTRSLETDAERYAQRQNSKLETFRGGNVIVISVAALVIILLVVLLLVLLL